MSIEHIQTKENIKAQIFIVASQELTKQIEEELSLQDPPEPEVAIAENIIS